MTALTRRFVLAGSALASAAAAVAAVPRADAGTGGESLYFKLHAWFFSHEMHLASPVDPQVFVVDPRSAAGVGPQGIRHAAGFRPALMFGPHDIGVYNAHGRPLGFTLAAWFAAHGTVRITRAGTGARVVCQFHRLRPNGVYSLFENHFDRTPVGFTPLDGAGTHNSFVASANGDASIAVQTPAPLTHANAVLLVYHSDNKTHGRSRGEIGVTAHHQLIARPPV